MELYESCADLKDSCLLRSAQFRNHKLVYRRYAGLFFSFCVDANDNELVWLEAIHLFVEVLGALWAQDGETGAEIRC